MTDPYLPSLPTSSTGPISHLRREVGLGGAILLGLGSMSGTGVFVSIGIGAGITGASVLLVVMMIGRMWRFATG